MGHIIRQIDCFWVNKSKVIYVILAKYLFVFSIVYLHIEILFVCVCGLL